MKHDGAAAPERCRKQPPTTNCATFSERRGVVPESVACCDLMMRHDAFVAPVCPGRCSQPSVRPQPAATNVLKHRTRSVAQREAHDSVIPPQTEWFLVFIVYICALGR